MAVECGTSPAPLLFGRCVAVGGGSSSLHSISMHVRAASPCAVPVPARPPGYGPRAGACPLRQGRCTMAGVPFGTPGSPSFGIRGRSVVLTTTRRELSPHGSTLWARPVVRGGLPFALLTTGCGGTAAWPAGCVLDTWFVRGGAGALRVPRGAPAASMFGCARCAPPTWRWGVPAPWWWPCWQYTLPPLCGNAASPAMCVALPMVTGRAGRQGPLLRQRWLQRRCILCWVQGHPRLAIAAGN